MDSKSETEQSLGVNLDAVVAALKQQRDKAYKPKRHLTQAEKLAKIKMSNLLINKSLPSECIKRLTHRAGAGTALWKKRTSIKKGLSIKDIIRIGYVARLATLELDTVKYRQCNLAPNPEKNPTGVVVESNKSYKLRHQDAMLACEHRNSPVYWDEIIHEARKSVVKNKTKLPLKPKATGVTDTSVSASVELDLGITSSSSDSVPKASVSAKKLLV